MRRAAALFIASLFVALVAAPAAQAASPSTPAIAVWPSNAKVQVTWGTLDANGAQIDGMVVQRSTSSSDPGSVVAILTGSNLSTKAWVDTGVSNGTTYYYRAYVYGAGLTSPTSSPVSVTPTTTPLSAPTLALVNADTGAGISAHTPISNGATFDFNSIGTRNLSVWAIASSGAKSARFVLDGSLLREDSPAPFTIAGDTFSSGGNSFNSWTPSCGSHSLTVTPQTFDSVAGTATTVSFTVTDITLCPFGSIWKAPIATNAVYAGASDPRTVSVRSVDSGYINANNGFGHPVYQAKDTDPLRTVTYSQPWNGGTQTGDIQLRWPQDANGDVKPAAGNAQGEGDLDITIIDPTKTYAYEFWQLKPSGSAYTSQKAVKTTLSGDGYGLQVFWNYQINAIRAAGFSMLAGLIRPEEVLTGSINHALVATLPNALMLNGQSAKLPAKGLDGYSAWYGKFIPDTGPATPPSGPGTGTVQMGQRFALPPTFNVDTTITTPTGLTASGKMLARALKTYGVYIGDTDQPRKRPTNPNSPGGNLVLMSEPELQTEQGSTFNDMKNDLIRLIPYIVPVD